VSLYGFSWIIPGRLAGMAVPDGEESDWQELRRRGVGAVVNLTTRDWSGGGPARVGMAYLHLPMADFAPPAPEQVDRFVEFCDRQLARDVGVAVHCVAGRGRTGTLAACYLVHLGRSPAEAIDAVRALRPGSIETAAQEEAVARYGTRQP
jgi:atypical dual specificity phosphatase